MPPRNRRLRFPDHSVTTVLVSHDGATWLPETLECLSAQTRPPQRVVAVDTGSADKSLQLLTTALGESAVLQRPRETSLGAAVQAGIDAFVGAPTPPGVGPEACEWLWLLHDDSAPSPDALCQLLERAEESPSAAVIGPKIVSWDGHRLLEVGVTTDSSGFRETGLEPREVDQGQHDDTTDVLAVGTAGMLVRRDVWGALGGLDPAWPVGGDDVDFGWRVNASGARVVVAPRAVVRHAQALTDGARSCDAVAMPRGAALRAHGMQVVLANTSPWLVLPLALRYVVEAVMRILAALILLRSPRRARDELIGIAAVVTRPHVVVAARRRRRRIRQRPHRELRGLLAPAAWRWRHAGDAVAGLLAGRAALDQRQRRRAPVETGPVADEAESFAVDDLGVLARFFSRPGVIVVLALTAAALLADRSVLGTQLHGGRLLPPRPGASDLWSLYLGAWHPVGLGSTTATPPSIAVLALLSTLLLGKVWLAVDVLMLGAVPLAGLVAYLAAGAVSRRPWPRVVAAVTYAVVPALTAAVAGGRIDVVVAVVLTPALLRAAAAALRRPALNRAIGAGLLLAVVAAVAPVVWVVAVVAVVVGVLLLRRDDDLLRPRREDLLRRAGAATVMLAVAPVVLVPWTWHAVRSPRLLVAGSGLPDTFASHRGTPVLDLLLVHPAGGAQPPVWVWAPILIAAVLALLTQRVAARVGFVVFAAATATALFVARLSPTGAVANARYWAGALLAVAAAGALTGALVSIDEGPAALRSRAFGWRHATAALLAAAAVVGVGWAAVGWLVRGSEGSLRATTASVLPVFAQAEAAAPTAPKILVLRSGAGSVHYALLRGPDGLRLGDADVSPTASSSAARIALSAAVADAAAGRGRALGELVQFGISLVVVPADSERALTRLGDVDGLARVPATSTVVYRVSQPAGELALLRGADARAAAAGVAVASQAKPQLLDAAPGHAHETLGFEPGGDRLLVLAEPYGSAWQASLAGHRLQPTRAYGWAQAWRLPSGGGPLVVTRQGDHRSALLVVELVLVALALILCLPARGVQR